MFEKRTVASKAKPKQASSKRLRWFNLIISATLLVSAYLLFRRGYKYLSYALIGTFVLHNVFPDALYNLTTALSIANMLSAMLYGVLHMVAYFAGIQEPRIKS